MGSNKTIYVKNEALWEQAKSIAGKAGLSAFIEEAVDRLVTVKRLEHQGLERFHFPVVPSLEFVGDPVDEIHHIGFYGKRLVDHTDMSIYLTKAGTFIVTDERIDSGPEGTISDYRTYDQCLEVRNDPAIKALEAGEQTRIWNSIVRALPPMQSTTWID